MKISKQLTKTSKNYRKIRKTKKKVVFADGEDENTLKAAVAFKSNGLGIPVLIGKKEIVIIGLFEGVHFIIIQNPKIKF